jgi:hypothetical protein
MAKADGIILLHAEFRTSPEDKLLIVDTHCFDFDFQFAMKYFRTLAALMQADGIPLSRQLRLQGMQCNMIQHNQFADTNIEWVSNQSVAEVPKAAMEAEEDDGQWVDVMEEL